MSNAANTTTQGATPLKQQVQACLELIAQANTEQSFILIERLLESFQTADMPTAFDAVELVLVKQQHALSLARILTRELVRRFPQSSRAWYMRGMAFLIGDISSREGFAAIERSHALNPRLSEHMLHVLGLAYRVHGQWQKAEAVWRTAIEIAPRQARSYIQLAFILRRQQRLAEALELVDQAIALAPNDLEGLIVKYSCLLDTWQIDEALNLGRNLYARFPAERRVNYVVGEIEARVGNWQTGWRHMQCMFVPSRPLHDQVRMCALPRKHFLPAAPIPDIAQWQGEPLQGKVLNLWFEYGYGDAILHARFLPVVGDLVRHQGGRLVATVYGSQAELFRSLASPDVTIQADVFANADFHLTVSGAAAMFGFTDRTLPGTPYLRANPARGDKWRQRLAPFTDRLNVGLAWNGNPNHERDNVRSMALPDLLPLLEVKGITFHSVNPSAAQDVARLRSMGYDVVDWSVELDSFSETAALLQSLNLLITIDSASGHLAGALGLPVFLMLDRVSSYIWRLSTDHTPWYDNVRIFRQTQLGQWKDVVERVRNELFAMQSAAQRQPLVSDSAAQ